MFERLAKDQREFEEKTLDHVNEYADAGLRTLILAYRELDEELNKEFDNKFSQARNSVCADRDALIEELSDNIERDLILLGATAVEDKLQNRVPDCIDKLAQAGIKIWVLTEGKIFACSLLRQGMKQLIIQLESPEIQALEKAGDKTAIIKASRESIRHQKSEGAQQLAASRRTSQQAFALIIDGKSLAFASRF